MMNKIKEILITIIFFLIVGICLWGTGHGIYCDYLKDEMHDNSCYWCNLYRYANIDNAAFQTRELRRQNTSK